MIIYSKRRIGFLVVLIAVLFSSVIFNVDFAYATTKSGYDAEQELKKQRQEIAAKRNSESKSVNKDILVVEVEDEEENLASAQKKPVGHQLYDTERHTNLYDKSNVITAGGGGNMGEGGGAARSAGGKAGKSVDFSSSTNTNQEVVSNKVSRVDGDDLISETIGFAKDDGKFYKEKEGDHAGAKIFEFDRDGSLGLNDEHIAASNMKGFMSFFIFAAFGLGSLSFFMAIRDVKSKNNYF